MLVAGNTTEYSYKTEPFRHQHELFERTRDLPAWALFWEQGTGKTKPILDTAAHLFETGKIDAVLVVAPNGVHRNWINDEIPAHMPERVVERMSALYYESKKAKTKRHQTASQELLAFEGLAFLAISYNGFMTVAGKKFVWHFLRDRRCLYILDESHHIKAPNTKRAKSVVASGKYAPYRRVLTGTPVAEGPFGAYTQMRFLQPDFWQRHGLGSYAAIKSYFGVWKTASEVLQEKGYDPGYDQLLGYKNLPHMQEILKELSDRVTKDDAGLDLPPKLFTKRYYTMSKAQQAAYTELANTYMLELGDDVVLDAELVIVRLLRLQQIVCGYAQVNSREPIRLVDRPNRRLEFCVEDVLADLPHQAIIWSRFSHDIDQLMDALGKQAVRYDGKVSDDECERSKNAFQSGEAKFFIGNVAKGKEGLTLTAARTVVYYANDFKLINRMQSEDRAHRIGQEHPVNYIDVIADDTVDQYIVDALRGKFDIQSQITGDKVRNWL